MDAITQRYSLPKAAELALIAGEDVVIFTNTDQAAAVIDGLVAAVNAGRLSESRVDDAVITLLPSTGSVAGVVGRIRGVPRRGFETSLR